MIMIITKFCLKFQLNDSDEKEIEVEVYNKIDRPLENNVKSNSFILQTNDDEEEEEQDNNSDDSDSSNGLKNVKAKGPKK
jgi:hypothetical protein